MKKRTYAYAQFSPLDFAFFRIQGSGLGNLLLPWARYVLYTKQPGIQGIAPTWAQFKPGPYLRNEKDKRGYVGLFRARKNELTGLRKALVLLSKKRRNENYLSELTVRSDELVVFSGLGRYFQPLHEHHAFIRSSLLEIVKAKPQHPDWLTQAIAVHVRLGDFQQAGTSAFNTRLPLAWYIENVRKLRELLGQDTPLAIFSDGSDAELKDLLSLRHAERMDFGSAMADLLALSQARVLVASNSTFSAWASFLGRMPSLWHGTGYIKDVYPQGTGSELCIEAGSAIELDSLERLVLGADSCGS
ncbi:MAG: alpha-1,2-fucosyltransferase [Myxococcales bacterium]|nr:MAG: alpha-1,2-fucosyltransferase [Myxococcales bacterium]